MISFYTATGVCGSLFSEWDYASGVQRLNTVSESYWRMKADFIRKTGKDRARGVQEGLALFSSVQPVLVVPSSRQRR